VPQAQTRSGGTIKRAGYVIGVFSHWDRHLGSSGDGMNAVVIRKGRPRLVSREKMRRAFGFEHREVSDQDLTALKTAEKLVAEGLFEDDRGPGPPDDEPLEPDIIADTENLMPRDPHDGGDIGGAMIAQANENAASQERLPMPELTLAAASPAEQREIAA
jgi:hypothetical protein